jgi:uncharacterized protein YjdB
MAVDRTKQTLVVVETATKKETAGTVGAKKATIDTGAEYNKKITAGVYQVYYKDAEGKKSDLVDVPEFTANPATVVTGVTPSQATMSLAVGANKALTATIAPENATVKDVTYTSSDVKIATVDASGKVVAVAEGKADITIASKVTPSATGKCAVKVTPAA